MPDKLPIIKAKELIKILKKAGFKEWRQRGGHLTLYKERETRKTILKKRQMHIESYQENLKKYKKLAHK